MSSVQVNDAKGEPMTKVLSGWTVAEVLKRIRVVGFLEGNHGVICGEDDLISAKRAPDSRSSNNNSKMFSKYGAAEPGWLGQAV